MVDKTYFHLLRTNTNSIDTYPTTRGHEIVNNVENTRVTTVLRFLKWLLRSSI